MIISLARKPALGIAALEAEILTPKGAQGVYLYLGFDVAKILKAVSRSKISQEVRDRVRGLELELRARILKCHSRAQTPVAVST